MAATKYVSTTGNDSASGSEAAPWKTWTKGWSSISAGDTLVIFAGDYTSGETWPINAPASGTGTNYSQMTRIISTNGNAYARPGTNVNITIHLNGNTVSNLWFQGIFANMHDTGSGGSGAGWRVEHGAHHLVFTNSGSLDVPNGHGMLFTPSPDPHEYCHHILITHCDVYRAGYEHALWDPGGSDDHGIYFEVTDSTIEYSNIYSNHSHAIHCFGDGTLRSIFKHNNLYSNGDTALGFYSGSYSNQIFNNLIWSNAKGIRLQRANTNWVMNNTFATNRTAIHVDEQATVGGSIGNTIDNNIITACTDTIDPPIQIVTGATNTLVRNNLSYLNSHAQEIDTSGSVNTTQSNNEFGDSFTAAFVDAANGNFRIQASGDADNNGLDESSFFTTSYYGVTRPSGSAFDIGAAELDEQAPQGQGGANFTFTGRVSLSGNAKGQ